MIIKTFRAETSSAALKRVRDEMGGDAIVLKTTQETGAMGRTVYEVTACLENPSVAQTSRIFPDKKETPTTQEPTSVQKPTPKVEAPNTEIVHEDVWQKRYERLEAKLNKFLEIEDIEVEEETVDNFAELRTVLQSQDISSEFINEFISELEESDDSSLDLVKTKLQEKLESYKSEELILNAGDKVAFVGPAGSGKSSVMGKMATSLVMKEKKKVTLLTLDDVKMGAFDETAAYAEILGADYADNRTVAESIQNSDSITLIDTVATPAVVENILPIHDKLNAIETSYRIAVFDASMRTKDVCAMDENMHAIGATHLVITKTDLTECVGTIISAAHAFGLKILYTSDSQGGIGVLHPLSPDELISNLFPQEVACE